MLTETKATRRQTNVPVEVKPTEAFEKLCRDLADDYAGGKLSSFIARYFAGFFVVLGIGLAFSLMYVSLPWFFFGISLAVSVPLTLLLIGDSTDRSTVKRRFLDWMVSWPIWEYVIWSLVLVTFLACSVVYQFWPPVLMGAVVGVVVAAIYYLVFLLPLGERRIEPAQRFASLVDQISRRGVNSLVIEAVMPKLLGANWMPVFENHFGYEVYRGAVQRMEYESPELLERQWRLRDFFCDFFKKNANARRGLAAATRDYRKSVLLARQARMKLNELESSPEYDEDDLDVIDSHEVEILDDSDDQQVEFVGDGHRIDCAHDLRNPSSSPQYNVNVDSLHVNTEEFWLNVDPLDLADSSGLGSLDGDSTHTSGASEKKRKFDKMMEDAKSPRAAKRARDRQIERYLGEEARLTIAILAMLAFGVWVYQSELLTGNLMNTHWAVIHSAASTPDGIRAFILGLPAVCASVPQSLIPMGVSGWGLGAAALFMGIASQLYGWRATALTVPAMILLLLSFTASLVWDQSRWLIVLGALVALSSLIGSIYWQRASA